MGSTTLAAVSDWFSWFPSEAIGSGLVWTTIGLLMLIGFVGTFLPIIPGTTMILFAAFIHYFAFDLEASGLAWQGLVFISVLWFLSFVVEWVSGALGAKWFGASRWGALGALVGGLVGIFFGLPGLILGPLIGAFGFELLIAKKTMRPATDSTVGTLLGGLAGVAAKVILGFGMISWYVVDVFLVN